MPRLLMRVLYIDPDEQKGMLTLFLLEMQGSVCVGVLVFMCCSLLLTYLHG